MKGSTQVAIIVLNWNGWRDTLACVASLQELDYTNYEIVIVDNGSTDGSLDEIRKAYPGLTLIQMADNLGFAAANNYAIRYVVDRGADFVWLLNNDTVVDPEALHTMVTEVLSDRRVGMVGSKIRFYQQPRTIGFAGGVINMATSRTRNLGRREQDVGQWDVARDVDYVSGCSMLVSRELVEDVGLMDRRFFLFFEETDWAVRARQKGWRVRIQPRSSIWHKVSAAAGLDSPFMVFHFTRSMLLFARKHSSRLSFTVITATVFWVIRPLLQGKVTAALAGVRGMVSGLAEM